MTELRTSANPYRGVGKMHDLFVRRPALLSILREGLERGSSLALVGPPGVGKSRLLRHLFKRYFDGKELGPHDLAVLYESPRAVDDLGFLQAFHTRIRKEVARRGFDWGEVPWVEVWDDGLEAVLERFDRLIAALQDEGLSLVWVIEPIDDNSARVFGRALAWLGEQVDRDVRLVTACRSLEALPEGWRARLDPVEVGGFTEEEAMAFLTRPLEGHPRPLSVSEKEVLIAKTGGHPARLHAAAAEAMDGRG